MKPIELNLLSKYRDEIYGASILWIMLFHGGQSNVQYFENIPILAYIGKLINAGNLGVEIFLMMSGICLYFSYTRNPDSYQFIKKRFKRIFPSLFLIFGIYWLWQLMRGEITASIFILNVSTLRFWVNGDRGIWFVSFILVCYLLFSYLYGFIHEKENQSGLRCMISCVFFIILVWALRKNVPDFYNQVEGALTRIPSFLIGIWLGKKVSKKETISAVWWILFCVSVVAYYVLIKKDIVTSGSLFRYIGLLLAIPMMFFIAKIASLLPEAGRKSLRFFGGISLELYNAHILLGRLYRANDLFFSYQRGNAMRWLGVLAISTVIAKMVSSIGKRLK